MIVKRTPSLSPATLWHGTFHDKRPPLFAPHHHHHNMPDYDWHGVASFPTPTMTSSTALCSIMPAHLATAVSSSSATIPTTGAVGLAKLFLAFVAGGLFFSTAIAAVAACYAVGMENVRRIWYVTRLVWSSVWSTFTTGLLAAKSALLAVSSTATATEKRPRESWKWRAAWQVWQDAWKETRKVAAQGVQAIRQEAKLYAAAVGAPGLIPIQYAIDRLLPFSIQTALQESLEGSLQSMMNPKTSKGKTKTKSSASNLVINNIKLVNFDIGQQPPQLHAARVYDLGREAMAMDCDITWDSDLETTLQVTTAGGLARVPVTIQKVKLDGVVRIVFTPLIKESPGYGALLVSLPAIPSIGMDVRVAGGDITRIPWLRSELLAAVQKGIADELLWPRRMVIPTMNNNNKSILSQKELDALVEGDPLLRAEQALAEEQPIFNDQIITSKQPDASKLRKLIKVFVNRDHNNHTTIGGSDEKGNGREDQQVKDDTHPMPGNGELTITKLTAEAHHHDRNGQRHSSKAQVQYGVVWTQLQKLLEN